LLAAIDCPPTQNTGIYYFAVYSIKHTLPIQTIIMRTCTSNLTSETVPVPLYRSTVSWSKVNFSSKNWPKYRCSKYLHARFFMLSDHGKPKSKYHGILKVLNIQRKLF